MLNLTHSETGRGDIRQYIIYWCPAYDSTGFPAKGSAQGGSLPGLTFGRGFMIQINIISGGEIFTPPVLDGAYIQWEERGVPGRLVFSVLDDGAIPFREGDTALLTCDGKGIFYGYIFSLRYDSDKKVRITAYDQLRYLKNKDTYIYSGRSASGLIRMIAEDFSLRCGVIENTRYVIGDRVEDNRTLFDIISSALDLTYQATGNRFILYDDFGSLTLKKSGNMRLDLTLDASSGEKAEYLSSIDRSYNKIKLVCNDRASGHREVYTASDRGKIDSWGVLQYYAAIDKDVSGREVSSSLLSSLCRKTGRLTVKGVSGDIRVRGGSVISADGHLMRAIRVKHVFGKTGHVMDLVLTEQ